MIHPFIRRSQLLTFNVQELLFLLGVETDSVGVLTVASGDERTEYDIADVCMSLCVERDEYADDDDETILPFAPA